MTLKPEHQKISAYYNLDNGTGRIHGVWMQGNLGVIPIFDQQGNPVGSLLATVFGAGAAGGASTSCGATGSGTPETPTALFPVDTNGKTLIGDMLSGLIPSLLSFLNGNSLLSGGLLGILP